MKIQPITISTTNTNLARGKAQSFRGLKGETNSVDGYRDMTQGIEETCYETKYYPFMDESKNEIERAKNRHYKSDSHDWKNAAGWGHTDLETHELDVQEKLPFTKREYERFQRGELRVSRSATDRTLDNMIRSTLKELHIK